MGGGEGKRVGGGLLKEALLERLHIKHKENAK
jgi:hypothetical protein